MRLKLIFPQGPPYISQQMQMDAWEEGSHLGPDTEHTEVPALPPRILCHTYQEPLNHLLVQKIGDMLHGFRKEFSGFS